MPLIPCAWPAPGVAAGVAGMAVACPFACPFAMASFESEGGGQVARTTGEREGLRGGEGLGLAAQWTGAR